MSIFSAEFCFTLSLVERLLNLQVYPCRLFGFNHTHKHIKGQWQLASNNHRECVITSEGSLKIDSKFCVPNQMDRKMQGLPILDAGQTYILYIQESFFSFNLICFLNLRLCNHATPFEIKLASHKQRYIYIFVTNRGSHRHLNWSDYEIEQRPFTCSIINALPL